MKVPSDLYQSSRREYRGLQDLEYPFHDRTVVVTTCGRICLGKRKINLSTVLAGQMLGIKEVEDGIWLVSFLHYDLRYIDLEQRTLQPIDLPIGMRVSPFVLGTNCHPCLRAGHEIFGDPDRIRTCDPQIRNLMLYPTELRGLAECVTTHTGSNKSKPNMRPRQAKCPRSVPTIKQSSATKSPKIDAAYVSPTTLRATKEPANSHKRSRAIARNPDQEKITWCLGRSAAIPRYRLFGTSKLCFRQLAPAHPAYKVHCHKNNLSSFLFAISAKSLFASRRKCSPQFAKEHLQNIASPSNGTRQTLARHQVRRPLPSTSSWKKQNHA